MSEKKRMPAYLRIRHDIREGIESGAYPAGTAIPSEYELAELYGVSRLMVRKAIDALADEGLVRRVQGKGAFSTGPISIRREESPQGFREQTRSLLHVPSVRILETRLRPAGPYYARLFSIGEDDDLYCVRRLNSMDDVPLSLEKTFIPCNLFPGITDVDVSVFSLYETYALLGHAVARSRELIDLIELSANDARLLGVKVGSPAMLLDCISYDADGLPVEHAVSYTRGDLGNYYLRY
jgi:GntR family transcriptional regulator